MYINGEWVLADGGATFDVRNPADGTVVARIANGAGPEIQRAVTAAHAAFREWSSLPPKDRGSILLTIQALMQERRDERARLVTPENAQRYEEARKAGPSSPGHSGSLAGGGG